VKLADVQNDEHRFRVRRLSTPFVADIKSGIGLWLVPFIGFFGFYLFIAAFNVYQRRTGSTPTGPFLFGR